MIKANDPELKSWIEVPKDSDFPIQNIPFGVFRKKNGTERCGTRIGDQVIDLFELAKLGYLDELGIPDLRVFGKPALNDFISLGKQASEICS